MLQISLRDIKYALIFVLISLYVKTNSAVSLRDHGPCGLESALLRYARSYSLRSVGPNLPYLLWAERPYTTLLATLTGGTDRYTHCSLYR